MGASNYTDAAEDKWTYEGNYTFSLRDKNSYFLTFTNIIKSGTGDWSGPKPIKTEEYMKPMNAIINFDGSCEFKKDKYGVFMKGSGNNVKEFFSNSNSNQI